MLATFSLIALLHGQLYALDTGLTGEDCIAAVAAGVSSIQITETTSVSADGATLYCEAE